MAYRFKFDEPFADGFIRIGVQQIERAETELSAAAGGSAVHETRKAIKRIRALLRLFRPTLGDETFREENARFRDIAALLSGARDQFVLVETLAKLAPLAHDRSTKSAITTARATMGLAANEGGHMNGAAAPAIEALSLLRDARKRFKRLEVTTDGVETIGRGLEASYRQGRRAFQDAYEAPGDEAFHDWRKFVQHHWRHMSLVSRAWPDLLGARVREARTLSQILGDDHDLAVLAESARSRLRADHAKALATLCAVRQEALRRTARPHGARLFADGPRRFKRRMMLYWTTACDLAHSGSAQPEPLEAIDTQPHENRARA